MRISSGGYVRSVAHDLGARLGCGAHLARLRREPRPDPLRSTRRSTLEELCAAAAAGTLEQSLPHPRTLLPELPATTADLWSAGRLRNGNPVNLPEFSARPLVKVFAGQRELVAIARRIAGTLFQPRGTRLIGGSCGYDFSEQREQQRQKIFGDRALPFVRRMDAVLLNCAGNPVNVPQSKGSRGT